MPEIPFEFRWVDPRELVPNPRNPRRMGREGMAKLERAIREFGFTTPALVQASSGVLIVGHQRTKAAIAVGLERIPSLWLEVDDEAAHRIMLADNRLGEEAEWDSERLAELFTEIGGEVAALAGFTEAEFDTVLEHWSQEVADVRRPRGVAVDWSKLGLFYHVADPSQLGLVPGIHQAAYWDEVRRDEVDPIWVRRPEGTRLLVLAGSERGIDRRGPLWGSIADAQEIGVVARDVQADVAEGPGVPLSPASLNALGMSRDEALEHHAACALLFSGVASAWEFAQLWRLPGGEPDHAQVLERVGGAIREGDLIGVEAGDDPGMLHAAVTAVLRAAPGHPVHLCGVSAPAVAAAGLAAGATSLDSPVAARSGWNRLLIPARRIDGDFGTRLMRFEELLSVNLAPTGKLKTGLAVANWITAALMFEATLAIAVGATEEVDLVKSEEHWCPVAQLAHRAYDCGCSCSGCQEARIARDRGGMR